jgi:hypothetical protein
MDPITAPAGAPHPVAPPFVAAGALPEDDVPLGWECANPALQIERWGMDEERAVSSNS